MDFSNLLQNRKSSLFWTVLIVHFSIPILVFFNIPFVRQILGFLYLTIIPGLVILWILDLPELNLAETILFATGLSISYLMFIGFLINEIYPLLGLLKPLSSLPLMGTINVIMSILLVVSYRRKLADKHMLPITKLPLSVPFFIFLPFLGIIGATFMNYFNNNLVQLFLIFIISVLVVFAVFEKFLPPRFYPLALLMIVIGLFFHRSFISHFITGTDVQLEYYVFRLTKSNSLWIPRPPVFKTTVEYTYTRYLSYNSMLSITILPTIYSNILNVDATWILKIIYPLLFSFMILGLYNIYDKQVDKKVALLSTFFFVSTSTNYVEMLGLGRQMIAEIFLVLLLILLIDDKKSPKKFMLFAIFSAALAVSHYSTSYLFIFLVLGPWLLSYIDNKKRSIPTIWVFLLSSLSFAWYIYVSESGPFNALLRAGDQISRNFYRDFFEPKARGQIVQRQLGAPVESIWHEIGRVYRWITQLFIIVGFVMILIKRKRKKLKRSYILLSLQALLILIFSMLIPHFAAALHMTRIYQIALIFLAPFCILGGKFILERILKLKSTFSILILILIILIPYFLFNVGFIYEVTNDVTINFPLSLHRMSKVERYIYVINTKDVFGAKWLSNHRNSEIRIYSDSISRNKVLTSYGGIYREDISILFNASEIVTEVYIYLSQSEIVMVEIEKNVMWNTTELVHLVKYENKIYSNGGTVIYKALEE